MQKAIIGRKVGMTQIFDDKGRVIPVTVIEAGPCVVVQKKTKENDGYDSVQLGFSDIPKEKEGKVTKPLLGHFKKAKVQVKRYLKEFRLEDTSGLNVGDELKADVFAEGDKVDITGITKGKGYAGAIKRHGSSRGRMTHGGGPVHRQPGSLGERNSARIFKGRKMAGHMGVDKVTVQNLDVVKVDAERNMIVIKGAIPGVNKGIVYLKNTVKNA